MKAGRLPKFALGSLGVLVAASLFNASAAANTVAPSNASQSIIARTIAQLAPPECAGMGLTVLRIGSGGSGGGNALVLGTSATETLTGGGGNDCIVGGGGLDSLIGQGGDDVLIGGPGFINVLNGGGGTDTCYRGSVWDILISCEVTH